MQAPTVQPNLLLTNAKNILNRIPSTGSYAGAGYLVTTLNSTADIADYARWLDLDDAITYTTWKAGNDQIARYNLYFSLTPYVHLIKLRKQDLILLQPLQGMRSTHEQHVHSS